MRLVSSGCRTVFPLGWVGTSCAWGAYVTRRDDCAQYFLSQAISYCRDTLLSIPRVAGRFDVQEVRSTTELDIGNENLQTICRFSNCVSTRGALSYAAAGRLTSCPLFRESLDGGFCPAPIGIEPICGFVSVPVTCPRSL